MSEMVSEFFVKNRPLDRSEFKLVQNHTENKLQEPRPPVNKEKEFRGLFFKEALSSIAEAVLFINLSGAIEIANDAAYKFFSLPSDATIGRGFWEFFPDDYFGFSMQESLKFCLPHRLIYKNQRLLELEISTSIIAVGSPADHGLMVIARDISERKRLQRAVQQGERMKELGIMAAQIAHEIRNPLGGIRGFASLLVRDLLGNSHLQEMAEAIIDGTKTLEKLALGILHYARPIQVQPQTKELNALIREIVKFVKIDPAFPPSIKIAVHLSNDPILVPVDADAFKSALLNLIFNAIQAMPEGGLLTLSLIRLEGCCQIAVADTGIGMDKETLEHLFSPFFTTKKMGNGLGLGEAEKIIKAHKGAIDVRSQPMKGSTFTITLPLRSC